MRGPLRGMAVEANLVHPVLEPPPEDGREGPLAGRGVGQRGGSLAQRGGHRHDRGNVLHPGPPPSFAVVAG